MHDSQPIRGKQKFFENFTFPLGPFGTSGTFWNLGHLGHLGPFWHLGPLGPLTCQQCFSQLVGKAAMPAPSVSSQGRENQENCKALSKFCRIVKLCFLAKWVSSHFWPVSALAAPILLPIWYSLYSPLQSIIRAKRGPTSPSVLMLVYI